MLRSLSYGLKMYGIAVVLVGLTACVTAVSVALVDRIETRLTVLADSYAPLADDLAAVEALALRQEILFERALLLEELKHTGARLTEDQRRFDALGANIDARLEASAHHIDASLEDTPPAYAIDALSGVGAELLAIEREHDDWEGHARRLLEHPKSWDEASSATVEREGDEYAAAIESLRATMGAYTRETASRARAEEAFLHKIDLALTALAAALGLTLAGLMTAGLVRPVRSLLLGMKQVEAGELDTRLEVTSRDEMGQLADGFNAMASELVVKERIQETFGRFVDPRIVRDLIDRPEITNGVGQRRTMSVLFSDIAGFTGLSERLTPAALVTALNAWLTTMSEPIAAENGVIDKYIGDAILAWWGPPFVPESESALRACRAALAKRARLTHYNDGLPMLLGGSPPPLDLRIGVATGPVIVGTIGSELARDYTVIGDTVNVGARLEAACKLYGIRTLVDEATAEAVKDDIALREIDTLYLAGKATPVRVFQLLELSERASLDQLALAALYLEGLTAYRARAWDRAAAVFQECLDRSPDDGPSRTMLTRTAALRGAPPGPSWDGVWTQRK